MPNFILTMKMTIHLENTESERIAYNFTIYSFYAEHSIIPSTPIQNIIYFSAKMCYNISNKLY